MLSAKRCRLLFTWTPIVVLYGFYWHYAHIWIWFLFLSSRSEGESDLGLISTCFAVLRAVCSPSFQWIVVFYFFYLSRRVKSMNNKRDCVLGKLSAFCLRCFLVFPMVVLYVIVQDQDR